MYIVIRSSPKLKQQCYKLVRMLVANAGSVCSFMHEVVEANQSFVYGEFQKMMLVQTALHGIEHTCAMEAGNKVALRRPRLVKVP